MSGTQAAGGTLAAAGRPRRLGGGADNHGGVTAQDAPERAQTAQDGRGQAGRYIYPLEGLNALTGLVGARRDMQAVDAADVHA